MRNLVHIFLFLPCWLVSQSLEIDSLDNYISKLVNEYRIPGIAIGVVHNDTVLFKKGYGTTKIDNGLPVSSQTVFPILSCTKAFTATCLGMLVDEGKLSWDDKVVKYLPSFKLSDPWITKEITIGDLLSHRSGLRAFDGDLLWYSTDYSRDEIIEKIQYYPIKEDFRLDFGYQNVMYLVAGKIVENASGLSWDDFVKTKIFNPLNMNASSTSLIELQAASNYAHPHIANKSITPRSTDNAGPAGSINSTIDDMLQWLQMCLNEGKWNGNEILKKQTFQTITSPKILLDNESPSGYGFGWFVDYEEGQKVLYHGGGMPGYKSIMAFFPAHKIGIVVLTNKITMINEGLVGMISSYIAHPEKVDWSDNRKYFTYFNYSWDTPKTINHKPNLPDNFEKYVGLYKDDVYGIAEIKRANEMGILELLPSKKMLSGHLYFHNESAFKVQFKDEFLPIGKVIFQLGKDQSIEGFTLDIPNDDFNFDNLNFVKLGKNSTKQNPH
ncbi:serine hydrolase domain-containing protein [Flagellimonas sp. 2504JD4-2]